VFLGTPESRQGGFIWSVEFYRKPNELEKNIAQIGDQFNDRKEVRKSIKLNNIRALFVTVTTQQSKDWISESVYFSKNNILFRIGNGAIKDERFKSFYESFKFLE
jgi:hypothetical protein